MERDEVILSSDDSESDTEMKDANNFRPAKQITDKGTVLRRAEMYQDYMKHIKVPTVHGSAIPCNSWQSLAKSLKKLYGQPLHYLTNVLLKEWDQSRIGSDKEYQPLGTIVHPRKAEATIWLMEEAHRLTTSPHHLAKLWLMDPMHHSLVDPIFPEI